MTGDATLAAQGHDYTAAMRSMHWSTVSLLIGSYSTAWAVEAASSSAEKAGLVLLHRSFGVTILILTAIRLTWRQRTQVPKLPADVPTAQRIAARASVVGFYTLPAAPAIAGPGRKHVAR
jgi:cytochrome b561